VSGKIVGYIRVSTADQNTVRQLDGIELDRRFVDQASGKDVDRPQLQECLLYLREEDELIVHSMDRLARNVEDMLKLVRDLTNRGVVVKFVKENLTFTSDTSPMSRLMLTLMSAFAEFERNLIRERQREGIAAAKARGVYKGRRPALTPDQVRELRDLIDAGVPKTRIAARFGVTRQTVYGYESKPASRTRLQETHG
jgi:DNA invertase Pin-like site-specific DNA recombinase